jgi:hypothetical protein
MKNIAHSETVLDTCRNPKGFRSISNVVTDASAYVDVSQSFPHHTFAIPVSKVSLISINSGSSTTSTLEGVVRWLAVVD